VKTLDVRQKRGAACRGGKKKIIMTQKERKGEGGGKQDTRFVGVGEREQRDTYMKHK